MTEQIGARIKEARLEAGMSQKALAEAVDGISASTISRAERGLKELTDEQLVAIAEATGSESLLNEVKGETPEVDAKEPKAPTAKEKDVQESPAEEKPDILKEALSALTGEEEKAPDPTAAVAGVAGVIGNILGGNDEKSSDADDAAAKENAAAKDGGGMDPSAMAAMMNMMGGSGGNSDTSKDGGGMDPSAMAAMMGMLGNMMGGSGGDASASEGDGMDPSAMAAMMNMMGGMMGGETGK